MARAVVVGFVFLVLVFGSLIVLERPSNPIVEETTEESYRLFRIENESCNLYYRECSCKGDVLVMESYPPQYRCQGEEICNDISERECR